MVVNSQERTAHYDPEVMPMYGVLIDMPEIQSWTCNGAQVAFSLESLQSPKKILDKVNEHGGTFG